MTFNKHILPNDLRLITVPMPDNSTVTVLIMVEAGSEYEAREQAGLSHFLEHMCFKGTLRRPKASDISLELDSLGAHYNAFTSHEFTGYFAKADFKHLDKILDVVSDLYLHPTFPEAEIEKEKGVIVEEINLYQDLPQRHVQDLFMELLYNDQPAGRKITGTRETVRRFTRSDFLSYIEMHYLIDTTVVVVAGDIDERRVVREVGKKFRSMLRGRKQEKPPVAEEQSEPRVTVEERRTDQTHLLIGVRTFPICSPSEPVLRLTNALLGGGMSSRLFLKLRNEMGVGYYVKSNHEPFIDHGILEVSTGVDKKRVVEVVRAIVGEFRRLCDENVSPSELKKVKDYLAGTLYLSLESSDERAEYAGYQEILQRKFETPSEVIAKLNRVSAGDLKRVARSIFRNDRLNLAIVGDVGDSSELKTALSI